jgi:hypothetical protein
MLPLRGLLASGKLSSILPGVLAVFENGCDCANRYLSPAQSIIQRLEVFVFFFAVVVDVFAVDVNASDQSIYGLFERISGAISLLLLVTPQENDHPADDDEEQPSDTDDKRADAVFGH